MNSMKPKRIIPILLLFVTLLFPVAADVFIVGMAPETNVLLSIDAMSVLPHLGFKESAFIEFNLVHPVVFGVRVSYRHVLDSSPIGAGIIFRGHEAYSFGGTAGITFDIGESAILRSQAFFDIAMARYDSLQIVFAFMEFGVEPSLLLPLDFLPGFLVRFATPLSVALKPNSVQTGLSLSIGLAFSPERGFK